MAKTLWTLCTIGISAGAAFADDPAIPWATDWDKALRDAKTRNVPIMFTVHRDG